MHSLFVFFGRLGVGLWYMLHVIEWKTQIVYVPTLHCVSCSSIFLLISRVFICVGQLVDVDGVILG